MPSATRAEAVKLDAGTNDLVSIEPIPGSGYLTHRHIGDLVAGDASEMGVMFGGRVEPGCRVTEVDGLHQTDVDEGLDRFVDSRDAHSWKMFFYDRVNVLYRRVRPVAVEESGNGHALLRDSVSGSAQSLTGRMDGVVGRVFQEDPPREWRYDTRTGLLVNNHSR